MSETLQSDSRYRAGPEFARRLSLVRERMLRAEVSAIFLPESADLEYLTGVPRAHHELDFVWDTYELAQGCFIGMTASPIFVFSHTQWYGEVGVAAQRYEVRVMPLDGNPVAWLRDAAKAAGVDRRLAVGAWARHRQLELLRDALPGTHLVDATDLVLPLRMQKDEHEIVLIREAGTISKRALEATLPMFSTSFSRHDFLLELKHQMLLAGAEGYAYGPDLYAVGPSTSIEWMADCHGAGHAQISAPAAVTVDFGSIHHGYRSDIGRVFYVGEPPSRQVDALKAVRRAQDAAIAALRPGVPAEEIDRVARTLMEEVGLGEAHSIPSGHGIGLECHEPPRFRKGVVEPILERAVVTVEIAAWEKGRTSAFWEDNVVVRPCGGERLTEGPDDAYVI